MSSNNNKTIHHLSIEETQNRIIEIKKEIIELNIKKATKQNIKSHILKEKKYKLAKLLTIETIKLKQENGN